MNATTEKTNAPNLAGSEALSETTEAISPLHLESTAAANDSQGAELTVAPGRIGVMRDWLWDDMDATAAALADWCRKNPAPDIKPAGDSNAPNLGFLLTVDTKCCVPKGHPKLGDVAFTHGCSFDLDKAAGFDIAPTLERTEAAGLAAVFWESHNSTEAEPKGRLLVILDPPCPADKHAAVYEQLRSELCPLAPKGQHNANRGWNPPRIGAEVVENDGRPVDWREVLRRAPRQPKSEPRSPSAAPQAPAAISLSHMEFAISMCQKHPPGTEDGRAGANLVSLGCKLILGCGLDIETAVVTALRYYDPRCTNAAGEPYPWGEDEIRRAFTKAARKEPSKDQAQWRAVLDEPEDPPKLAPSAEPEPPAHEPVAFPLDAVPSAMREWIVAAEERYRAPRDLIATAALGAMCAAVQGNVGVQVEADYAVPTSLYFIAAALPGESKSPVFKAAFEPIQKWELHTRTLKKPQLARARAEREAKAHTLEALRKQAKALASKPVEKEAARDTWDITPRRGHLIEQISKLSVELDAPEPADFRYQVQDATPAALVSLFAQHGRLACVTAEGHEVFQTITGARFSSSKNADPMGSDLNVILEAYDNNPVRVDRVGRDVKEAGRAALSILLAVQPEVLDQAVRNSALMQRGLLDRFCFVRAQSAGPQMRSPEDRPRAIPASVSTAYAVELKRMCDVPGGTVIKASPEAERLWFEYKL